MTVLPRFARQRAAAEITRPQRQRATAVSRQYDEIDIALFGQQAKYRKRAGTATFQLQHVTMLRFALLPKVSESTLRNGHVSRRMTHFGRGKKAEPKQAAHG